MDDSAGGRPTRKGTSKGNDAVDRPSSAGGRRSRRNGKIAAGGRVGRRSLGDAPLGVKNSSSLPLLDDLALSRFDSPEDTVDAENNLSCCNMKLSQLSSDAPADAFYNRFEQTIVEARQERHQSHPGRSIPSIRKNPRHRSLGLSLVSLGSSDRDMSLVTDHVLIGGKSDAEDLARLMDFGVTHVLNTAQQVPNYYQQQFVYLKVAILDSTSTEVLSCADAVSSFLQHAEAVQGRVLVHCVAGVSRSVSMVILHLVRTHRLPLLDAYTYLHSCRNQICPNNAFKLQLARMELAQLGCSSVAKAQGDWDFYEWNKVKQSVPIRSESNKSDYQESIASDKEACCSLS